MNSEQQQFKQSLLNKLRPYLGVGGGSQQEIINMMFMFAGTAQRKSNPYIDAVKHVNELHEKLTKLDNFDWFVNSQWWWQSSVNSAVNKIESYNRRLGCH